MNYRRALLGLAFLSLAAHAHERTGEQRWTFEDGWVVAGVDEAKAEMTFVSTTRVLRAGSAAQVETLRVHRDIDERFGTDQAHYHMLVDCSDLSWTRISFRGYRPDGTSGPLITRDLGSRPPPPEGGILRKAFELTCSDSRTEEAIIADPYGFAKQHFAG
ncbi:MAG: hypothetical protein EP341_02185 [Sphingomonadales bacterium]|nr:MAG: hypothetical protein EP341_02185 [Sphingomonadales bacterium]